MKVLALWAGRAAAAILVCEALFRLFYPQMLITPAYDGTRGARFFSPNARVMNRSKYYDVVYGINALGFRGKLYGPHKEKGVYRIVALGPSRVFGWGVDDDEVFTAVLEKKLNSFASGRHYEVMNMGGLASPINSYEPLLKDLLAPYDPDFFIVLLSHHHFAAETVNKTESLKDVRTAAVSSVGPLFKNMARGPAYKYLCEHSQLWSFLLTHVGGMLRNNDGPRAEDAPALQRIGTKTFDSFLHRACSGKSGFRVLILKDKSESREGGYYPVDIPTLEAQAERDPCFKVYEFELPPGEVFGPDDIHWKKEGHEVVARRIMDIMFRNKVIGAPPPP